MIAEPLPIGVVRNPISASEPCFDCPLQSSKGLVFLTKDCEDTARVVEGLLFPPLSRPALVLKLSFCGKEKDWHLLLGCQIQNV